MRVLKKLIGKYKHQIIFLMENKHMSSSLFNLQFSYGFHHSFYINLVGKSGGFCLWWNDQVNCLISHDNQYLIETHVSLLKENISFRLSCIWALLICSNQLYPWNLLKSSIINNHDLWLWIDDFNNICSNKEKLRGTSKASFNLQAFWDLISNYQMMDMDF